MVALWTRGSLLRAAMASSFTLSSSVWDIPTTRSSGDPSGSMGLGWWRCTKVYDPEGTARSSNDGSSRLDVDIDDDEAALASASRFVRTQVARLLHQTPTLRGPILRLAFHDATVRSSSRDPCVGGADGSIRYELEWSENRGLSRPLEAVTKIYEAQRHRQLPHTGGALSFADTLALAGAEAVRVAGGPSIPIRLGRTDVPTADRRTLDPPFVGLGGGDRTVVKTSLPSAGLDSLGMRNYFGRLGLSEAEMVALNGAHDLGRHVSLLGMPRTCLRNLTRTCLEEAPVLLPFVKTNPDTLSNDYYQTLLRWNDQNIEYGEASFLPTDVALVVDEDLQKHVVAFSKDQDLFFRTFARAYQKLVDSTATSASRF